MRCYGEGSPAIILEVGTDSSGIDDFPVSFLRPLADEHMTCSWGPPRGLVAAQFEQPPRRDSRPGPVGRGSAEPEPRGELPGEVGWRNPEHLDWVDAELRLSTLEMPVGDFPVLIVVSDGSDTPDQSFWLDLSPLPRRS